MKRLLEHERKVLTGMICDLEKRATFENMINSDIFTIIEHKELFKLICKKRSLSEHDLMIEINSSNIMQQDKLDDFIDFVEMQGLFCKDNFSINELLRFKRYRDVKNKFEAINPLDPQREHIEALFIEIDKDNIDDLVYGNIKDCYFSVGSDYQNREELEAAVKKTGLNFFDDLLSGGLVNGMHTISGRGGAGKTSLAVNAAIAYGATNPNEDVFFFSGEVGFSNIAQKVVSHTSGIYLNKIQNRIFSDVDQQTFVDAAEKQTTNVYFVEVEGITTNQGLSIAKKISEKNGREIGLMVYDYLQLMKPNDKTKTTKFDIIEEVSSDLRAQGKNYRVINISNMTKEDGSGEPSVKDLKGSSQIEYDSTSIIMLWKEDANDKPREVRAKTIKNRWGESPKYDLLDFDGATGTFKQMDGNIRLPSIEEIPWE